MKNIDIFMEEYRKNLTLNLKNNPKNYAFSFEYIDTVLFRMRDAIIKGTFNKDSESLSQTCKTLGIKYTYKAIKEYIA